MGIVFVNGTPDDERIAAIAALAVGLYLDANADIDRKLDVPTSRWLMAGRFEAQRTQALPNSLPKGWRAQY